MAQSRNWKGGLNGGAPAAPPELAAFEASARALLAMAPDPGGTVAMALDGLHGILAAGAVPVSRILGMRQYVRQAIRLAWTDGVRLPLVRSDDVGDRILLAGIPDLSPIDAHAVLGARIAHLHSATEPGPTRDHLGRAIAFAAAVPVILQALDALEGLDPARDRNAPHGPGEATPEAIVLRRVVTARRRIRTVIAKGMPALTMAIAAGLVEDPHPLARGAAFKASRPLIDRAPAGVARLRDRAGMAWRSRLGEALSLDLGDGLLAPEAEAAMRADANLAYVGSSFATTGLEGSATVMLERPTTRVRIRLDFDAGNGDTRFAFGIARDGEPFSEVSRSRLDAEIAWAVPAPTSDA